MIPIPLTWVDFADGEVKEVVVEHDYCEGPGHPILTALIPARAYHSEDGYLVVEYIRYVHLELLMRRTVHWDTNYPIMYPESRLHLATRLNMALGNLVLWDKKSDTLVKSNGIPWWALFEGKSWFEWDIETGDYTKKSTRV